eukprot:760518-Hanusia_phi.AAC.5
MSKDLQEGSAELSCPATYAGSHLSSVSPTRAASAADVRESRGLDWLTRAAVDVRTNSPVRHRWNDDKHVGGVSGE